MTRLHRPSDYRAIEAWGRLLRSYDYYIQMQQSQAHADEAPLDAIYKSSPLDGTKPQWRTLREVENPDTRAHFRLHYPDLVPAEWGAA
jgi:hypothetical protein